MSSMSDSDDFDTQEIDIEIVPRKQEPTNIKKYISQPNQLLDKILFCQYQAISLFPTPFTNLPSFVKPYKAQIDPNNMNAIYESHFHHEKLKKDVINFLLDFHGNKQPNKDKIALKRNLPTMTEYYQGKQPIYQKYPQSQKPSSLATFMIDPKNLNPPRSSTAYSTANNFYHSRKNSSTCLPSYRSKIQFSSSFCSGNLFQVHQVAHNEFDLILQNDINTRGNNQWFFFSIKGVPKNLTCKFNIVNMTKKHSLFQDGMKPCVFSQCKYEKRNVGWVREGMKIHYSENQKFKKDGNQKKPYYQLSFEYKFVYEGDVVYFSQSVPYTVSDLTQFLSIHLKDKKNNKLIRVKNLGRTLGNQQMDIIQITNEEYRQVNRKKTIWIIARQHSGQVTSSFMMEGIINKLLDHSDASKALLKNYIFKIVPMVNIDGVVHGNTRAQFSGADPNRRWINPHKIRNPIIYALKKAIQKDKNMNGVQMFLDLHSHSRKLGTFFYGNSFLNNKNVTRKYPMMVCKKDQRFSYEHCRYSPCNPSSARQVLFDYLQIPLVYTVESSFYGYKKNETNIVEYLPKDYKQMGTVLIDSLWEYASQKYKNFEAYESINELMQASNEEDEELEKMRIKNQQVDDFAASDSDPSGDELDEKALKEIMPGIFCKKKKKQKKKVKIVKKKEQAKKQEPSKVPPKIKKTDKQSHYRIYFSGRTSCLDRKFKKQQTKLIKQTSDQSVQVMLPEQSVLKTCSNIKPLVVFQKQSGLCVTGQKVEEDVIVFGNHISVQVELNRNFLKSKDELRQNQPRKSFKVTTNRGSSLQTKQNNFLNRADCHTLGTTFNFLTRRNY